MNRLLDRQSVLERIELAQYLKEQHRLATVAYLGVAALAGSNVELPSYIPLGLKVIGGIFTAVAVGIAARSSRKAASFSRNVAREEGVLEGLSPGQESQSPQATNEITESAKTLGTGIAQSISSRLGKVSVAIADRNNLKAAGKMEEFLPGQLSNIPQEITGLIRSPGTELTHILSSRLGASPISLATAKLEAMLPGQLSNIPQATQGITELAQGLPEHQADL